jgi:hypothetical protein
MLSKGRVLKARGLFFLGGEGIKKKIDKQIQAGVSCRDI